MPLCCVPQCTNTEKNPGIKFHRFPADEKKSTEWLKRIRRDNYNLTFEARICSAHFIDNVADGPKRFAWNINKNFDVNGLSLSSKKPGVKRKSVNSINVVQQQLSPAKKSRRKQLLSARSEINSPKHDEIQKIGISTSNVAANENKTLRHSLPFPSVNAKINDLNRTIQNLTDQLLKSNNSIRQMKKEKSENELKIYNETIVPLQQKLDEANLQIIQQKKKYRESEKRINYLQSCEQKQLQQTEVVQSAESKIQALEVYIQAYQSNTQNIKDVFDESVVKTWKTELLSAFTGFQHYSSINLLIEMLEHKNLQYQNGHSSTIKISRQVLMFLFKLKLDLPYEVLSNFFMVSTTSVRNIFKSVLVGVYEIFYEGNGPLSSIPPRAKTKLNQPKCFSSIPNCRIVIDCTEFTMQSSAKMADKKIVYSNYKSRYTMKVLIGCAPNGTPTFVSNLFGGSESDKSIVSKSGLLDQMVPGDIILADKGFQLYDILPPGVGLNIPSFLVKNQFTVCETLQNVTFARARVIIERLNARFKVFRILDCVTAKNRSTAEYIVKVCVALTTLMPTLMAELNN